MSNLAVFSSRRALVLLAGATVVMFVIAVPTGSDHHGVVNVLSNITWYAGLIGVLLLIVVGLVALLRMVRTKTA